MKKIEEFRDKSKSMEKKEKPIDRLKPFETKPIPRDTEASLVRN